MRFLSAQAAGFSRSRGAGSTSLRHKLKRFFDMLVLTPREQRVVIGITVVVMLVMALVHYRMAAARQALPRLKTMDQTGDVKTRLTDDAGSQSLDERRK